jgi:multicomponent Na+:H+ antiporter subunit G
MSDARTIVATALTIIGLLVMTGGVIGMLRLPDIYGKVHAAGAVVFLGVIAVCIAAAVASDAPAIRTRVVLIAIFLLLTTPVASHVIVQAARQRGEPMAAADALDEERDGLPGG